MSCCDLLTTLPASPSPDLHTCVCMDTCRHTRISWTWALLFSRLWLGYCTLLLHTGWLSICTCTCALPGAGVYPVACKGEHCTAPSALPPSLWNPSLSILCALLFSSGSFLWHHSVSSFSLLGGHFSAPFFMQSTGKENLHLESWEQLPNLSQTLFSSLKWGE